MRTLIKDGKTFLLLCVDIAKKDNTPVKGKKLYAFLGVLNPICCFVSSKDDNDISQMKIYEIGTREEFNYRRRQIQEAVRRLQTENKYNKGGKGRKRKMQAVGRFHEKEKHYVDTRLHTYSRLLVDFAAANRCEEIVLLNQTHREDEAKADNMAGESLVFRNWSYFGLKSKIEYKAKMYNMNLTIKQ